LRADFYYLTRTPLEKALPGIAERVRASGEKLLILGEDAELLDRLDLLLWTYRADSFLPHGREGDQPILLATSIGEGAAYPNLAYVDGVWRDAPEGTVRVFYFFDEATRDAARNAWRQLAGLPIERRYWKQEEGGRWAEGP
jgi:DNA polymerase-3 subunit chi